MTEIKNCSICDSKLSEDEIKGYFGILPVGFCVWCMSSITDMVIQLNGFDDVETLKERIGYLEEDEWYRLMELHRWIRTRRWH